MVQDGMDLKRFEIPKKRKQFWTCDLKNHVILKINIHGERQHPAQTQTILIRFWMNLENENILLKPLENEQILIKPLENQDILLKPKHVF